MAITRTTKSGYTFQILSPKEIVARASGDHWVYTCGIKKCGIPIQGGRAAVDDHYRVVHPDHR